MIVNAQGITIVPMKIEEDGMTGIPMTDGNETTEVEDAKRDDKGGNRRQNESHSRNDWDCSECGNSEFLVQNRMQPLWSAKRTSWKRRIQNSGPAMIEELVTGMKPHNQGQEIGNVASARK